MKKNKCMELKLISENDKEFVKGISKNLSDTDFDNLVFTKSGYIIYHQEKQVGIILYCLLWNKIPFMNLIYIDEKYRNLGLGTKAIINYEKQMKIKGYKMVLTSTQVDEKTQNLYRKLGYLECGGMVFNNTPYDQPMEMFFNKVLSK